MGPRNQVLDGVQIPTREGASDSAGTKPVRCGTRLGCTSRGAHWRQLANTSEPSVRGGDAALRQITSSTCHTHRGAWLVSAEAIYDDFADRKFRTAINSDGGMQWSPGGRFVTSCQLDITFYPFDRQQCELDFVDWTVEYPLMDLCNVRPTDLSPNSNTVSSSN